MFNKGDIVEVYGRVFISKRNNERNIYTHDFSTKIKHYGIVLGYSFVRTGKLVNGGWYGDEYQSPYLKKPIDNKVWIITPLTHGNRYIKHYRCLNSQIRKVKSVVWDK